MGGFQIPAAPERSVAKIDTFKGVDLNSSPSNVKIYRSPNAPNMMRDIPGKVRKRQGYEKLTGFESENNGYEWFGGDPGHEALTAYGLMQFHEMKEVMPVDRSMLERTEKWCAD